MEDITPDLLKKIQEDFDKQFDNSKVIAGLYTKVQDGTATYLEANEFAIEVGDILAGAYKNNLSSDVLPDGRMYYNIAQRIIDPTMKNNYSLIIDVTNQVQKSLNEAAHIGIKAITPELNQDRIDKIIDRVSDAEQYDDISWILDEPVKNFSQSIVDDAVRVNADFQYKAGMSPKIVRKLAGGCCDWCRAVAGTYTYPDVPKDVYRRHQRCRCTVEYNPRDGKIQNVHSKKWRDENELDKIEARKKIGSNTLKGQNVTPMYYGTAKPGKGKIAFEEGLDIAGHANEIKVADFLKETFGGDILVQKEVNKNKIKTSDYLWNNKKWELKTLTTENAADSAVRGGLKQISGNTGGLILDYSGRDVNLDELLKVIDGRMRRGFEKDTDIMIKLDEKTVKVYRYKK